MNSQNPPQYNFNDPVFSQRRNYLVYAKEHLDLWDLRENSDVIDWEIKSTVSSLNIPTVYHVTYHVRSIVGIDAEAQPKYANQHLMELSIPTRYPLEPAQIYMRTPIWHPNIQSEGRFIGKICGNVKDYGIDYSLRQLVLRVGEILQYRNYLADFVAPFPEDPKVAEWVKAYAEPRGIVDRSKGIFTDEQPLIRPLRPETEQGSVMIKPSSDKVPTTSAPPPLPDKNESTEITPPPLPSEGEPTMITSSPPQEPPTTPPPVEEKSDGITIKRRDEEEDVPKRRKIVLGNKTSIKKDQE